MSAPVLIGTVAEKDGMLCLQTAPNAWYPIGGASALGFSFREAFGRPQKGDIGKRVYRVGEGAGSFLQMENNEQRDARIKRTAYGEPTPFRVYAGGRAVIYARDLKQRAKPLRDVMEIRQVGLTPEQFSALLEKIEPAVRAAISELEL